MAGHSKWANIKHRKAGQDAKRGKVFTKLIREIVVAARAGGPLPDDNPRLRAVVDKALTANMKRDTIDKAIARGAGNTDTDNYDEVTYEGYGSGGVAVLVECMTDNRNRTVADVRHAFNKRGGNLGTDGSVAYLFTRIGQIVYGPDVNEDALIEVALEAGANDIVPSHDGGVEVQTEFSEFLGVKDTLLAAGFSHNHADIQMLPATSIELDLKGAESLLGLVDALEDLDDVQNVYTNADIPDDVFAELAGDE
ncbi:Transcriptional regulatory protein PmpR [Zhongshania aliphaticivorans]|uniref:Probable transcriptional regulatory protein IHBHHGIJ_02576 n=1 Tax=Zhongshania aliphaticivorans TaxID=1470434 RepID=A0A5S9NU01_9GAMM|nr:YebC/PmpR family DNA-binding transcriptional regulator [Zhongshania aliphaticivorans]CAA0094192.1 Transcriptional regulatory protein PmpR [Zhongshania aliphaticivorans]CAA0112277.1 Transcriptional regulatory protein PmpR [Zhongshania aliphaticivorans]